MTSPADNTSAMTPDYRRGRHRYRQLQLDASPKPPYGLYPSVDSLRRYAYWNMLKILNIWRNVWRMRRTLHDYYVKVQNNKEQVKHHAAHKWICQKLVVFKPWLRPWKWSMCTGLLRPKKFIVKTVRTCVSNLSLFLGEVKNVVKQHRSWFCAEHSEWKLHCGKLFLKENRNSTTFQCEFFWR